MNLMKTIKTFFILTCILQLCFISCSKKITKTKVDNMTSFFYGCEKDLERAANVIAEKELIKILTHLQIMNTGGKKYYPLEREALTKMINSLITYTYSDCILVNNKGTIVYTMYNNDIFSKNVKYIPGAPFADIFTAAMKNEPIIIDVTKFPEITDRFDMFFSKPIIRKNKIYGILIASIDINQLKPILKEKTYIVDQDGIFRFHTDRSLIFSTDPGFINKDAYSKFSYKNITWYISSN